jgi:secreted Zn-dependent insulinase-like peptidase
MPNYFIALLWLIVNTNEQKKETILVESVFSYLDMLHDERMANYVFENVLQLSELERHFLSTCDPGGYAQSLAHPKQKYKAALYIDMQKPLTTFSFSADHMNGLEIFFATIQKFLQRIILKASISEEPTCPKVHL